MRSVIIICLTIVLGWALTGCGESKKIKNEDVHVYSKKLMKIFSKPNQEAIALLSLKYDIQPSVIESLLDSYLTETDIGYKILKQSFRSSTDITAKDTLMEPFDFEKESYSKALAKASQSVGITLKTAALLVSDYKMFATVDKSSK